MCKCHQRQFCRGKFNEYPQNTFSWRIKKKYKYFSVETKVSSAAKCQGPVVQSILNLSSSLSVVSLTDLANSIYNILIFLLKKCKKLLHCKSYSHFFQQKISAYLRITDVNFNKSFTNDIVSFEQLGPDKYKK